MLIFCTVVSYFYDGFGLVDSYLAFKKTCGVVDLRSSDALRRKTENDYAQ